MREFTVNENASGQKLHKYIKRVLPQATDSFIFKMLRKKNIKLNDGKASGNEIVKSGDNIKIYFSEDTFLKFSGNENNDIDVTEYVNAFNTLKNIKVIYEDDDIVIFDKPVNILSQKAKDTDVSLNEYLIGYLLNKEYITKESLKEFKPSVLNRLDRNTSGLIIGSKSVRGAICLSKLIKERSLKKYYRAEVVGILNKELDLKGYLIKDKNTNTVKIFDEPMEGASFIHTRAFPCADVISSDDAPITFKGETTSVYVELITGKSHQIRAHLSHAGFPLVGDPKYGDISFNKKHNAKYQELVSSKLVFPDECEIPSLKGLVIELK